jgi:hypothetical protein
MKKSMKFPAVLTLAITLTFVFLFSCEEENHCDSQDYAQPEISIVDPEDGVIVISYQGGVPIITMHIKAEAGLNTLTMLDPWGSFFPIQVFTNGETELDYSFVLHNVYDGKNTFVLHDMCNQRAEVELTVIFE